ncbi:hypothetical protein RSSM_04133 [Rhodopirellula sallentina SM41]|uniref:Uncharacterized protein n=1 Tax=Rhodopirellula sallentina SM41 TaxID=1263870 RepID=M5TYX6_9BACT|nr:hypothetical protein RSSM_04133 [Rhodopirellula sallentina SM41]
MAKRRGGVGNAADGYRCGLGAQRLGDATVWEWGVEVPKKHAPMQNTVQK